MSTKLFLRLILGLLFTIIIVLASAVGIFQLADNDQKKSWVSAGIRYVTGRELVIGEIVHMELGSRLSLVASDVALSNAEWSESPLMWRARGVEIDLELLPLLGGVADFSAKLKEPELLLEVNEGGVKNWHFLPGSQETTGRTALYPRFISIEKGRLRYAHATRGKSDELILSNFQLSTLGQKSELTLDGRYNEIPLQLRTRYESVQQSGRLPIVIEGHLGRLSINAKGLAGEEALTLQVAINAPSLRFLDAQWIKPLPDHGPLSGQFEFKRKVPPSLIPSKISNCPMKACWWQATKSGLLTRYSA